MKRLFILVFAALCAAPAAPPSFAQAQTAAPAAARTLDARAAVADVAQLVEENFFDPERGRAIADQVRERAQSGGFDRFTNPYDLATALTEVLHPHDGHFNVAYRPAGAPAGGPPSQEERRAVLQRGQAAAARGNFGFRRVEMLPGGVGYILLDQFAGFNPLAATPDPARRAADAAMAMIAGANAVIIDLRDSRGGSPAMVAYVASYFTPAGADIFNTFHSRRGTTSEAPVIDPTGPRRLEVPLYILVNGGSGSASESLPYTLQAARRAAIVGEPSNGRANPGGFLATPQGFAVFVSSGTPVNPITGRNWEGTGVIPDIAVASIDALTRAHVLALEALIAAEPEGDTAAEARLTLEVLQTPPRTLSASELRGYAGAYGERTLEIADGRLILNAGRRRATLRTLARDVFTIEDAPLVRVRFERDARGRVVAFEWSTPAGDRTRFLRS